MKTEIKIEECEKPFCVIHAAENNASIQALADKISMLDQNGKSVIFNGWDGDFCVQIPASEVYRIYSMDKKVFITTKNETFILKSRLYEIEEKLSTSNIDDFIRISNSDIVNFKNAQKLDMSITGVIKVILKNDEEVIVSRRYMTKIRSELCLKK